MPDSVLSDPYQTPTDVPEEAGISLVRKLAAAALGVVVAIAAAATLSAFLFGLLVAVGGQFQTAPVDLSGFSDSTFGVPLAAAGLVAIAVVSILLGFYSATKVLRTSRRALLCEYRRRQLNDMVRDYRDHKARTQRRATDSSLPREPASNPSRASQESSQPADR